MDPKHVGRISGSLFDGDFPHEEFGTAPQTQPVVENTERAKTVPGIGGLWGSQSLRAWRGLHIAWTQKTGDGEYDACKVLAAMAMRGRPPYMSATPMYRQNLLFCRRLRAAKFAIDTASCAVILPPL